MSVLRIHDCGLFWRKTKQTRIKSLEVGNRGYARNIVRVLNRSELFSMCEKFCLVEGADGFFFCAEVRPKFTQ